jgi:hypothetical protein
MRPGMMANGGPMSMSAAAQPWISEEAGDSSAF